MKVLPRLALLLLLLAPAAAPAQNAFKIPLADDIVIDGQMAEDWDGEPTFRINPMVNVEGVPPAFEDLNAEVDLAWDTEGLLLCMLVQDDIFTEEADDLMYQGDSVELFFSHDSGGKSGFQVIIGPGMTKEHPELRLKYYDRRQEKSPALEIQAVRTRVNLGYLLEARIPWAQMGITPEPGVTLQMQVVINDADPGESRYQSVWYPSSKTSRDYTQMFQIQLAQQAEASPAGAVRAAPMGDEVALRVVTKPELTPREVEFRAGERVLASVELPAHANRAGAIFPAKFLPESGLTAHLDGKLLGPVILPSAAAAPTGWEIARLDYSVTPTVFEGEAFPNLQLKESGPIINLLGPIKTAVQFYDANYNEVERPTAMGRYGAVLTITAENREPIQRHITLFRQPQKVDWESEQLSFSDPILPPSLGLDPAVVREHTSSIAGVLNREMSRNLAQNGSYAVLLAGLAEAKAQGRPATHFENTNRLNSDWWYGFRKKHGLIQPFERIVQLPPGYDGDPEKRWPLVLFLHGAGEGDNMEALRKWGIPKEIANGREFPFITVAPRSEPGQWMWWNSVQLGELLDEVEAEYRVDPTRIYVTGLSMGGFGSWALAMEFPDRFAAIAPICGGGTPEEAARIAHIPTWTFHGEKDDLVPVQRTRDMVAALEKVGGTPKVTYFPEAGHNSWDVVYTGTELYEWLLSHQKKVTPP